jgi:hypothetical protein
MTILCARCGQQAALPQESICRACALVELVGLVSVLPEGSFGPPVGAHQGGDPLASCGQVHRPVALLGESNSTFRRSSTARTHTSGVVAATAAGRRP